MIERCVWSLHCIAGSHRSRLRRGCELAGKQAVGTELWSSGVCCVAAAHAGNVSPWEVRVDTRKLDTDTYEFSLCLKPFS